MTEGPSDAWMTEVAEVIATYHAIDPETVRGWLAFGIAPDVADCFAELADYGYRVDQLNAAVYALVMGRPIGTLGEMDA